MENDVPADKLPVKLSAERVKAYGECLEWGDKMLDALKVNTDIDTVVFVNRTSIYQIPAAQAIEVWKSVEASGKTVIAVRDVPGMKGKQTAPQCIEEHANAYDPCAWTPPDAPDFMVEASAESGVPLIDLTQYFCDEAGCHAVIGGAVVYYDSNHLTYTFTQTLAPFLGAAVAAELK